MQDFTQFIKRLFEEHKTTFSSIQFVDELRNNALQVFFEKELPTQKLEKWRHHAISKLVENNYFFSTSATPYAPVKDFFKCNVKNIDTLMFTFLNGWYLHDDKPLTRLDNGIIIGSILTAFTQYPELLHRYFAQTDLQKNDGLIALNQALFSDGLFIYVPANVNVDKPIQMVSLVENDNNIMIQQRNLIVLGQNASLSLVQCDDSLKKEKSFINNVTEICLEEGANFNFYKMENKSSDSLLVNNIFVTQKQNSHFFSNAITFNGGYVRNFIHVDLNEAHTDAKLYGLYLVDKKQYVDNQVDVIHNCPNTTSYQLYKGIADDEAGANFNGHILVKPHAQNIEAYQANKNIALTDTALITTNPFLEIYADDVKCSHGATIGQLDEEALFYLRSRGICKRNARMLLMYAFANEVVNFVKINELQQLLTEMIKKRLSGELNLCDQCVLHCSDEKKFNFDFKIQPLR